jgi:PKD repeat protein
MKIHILLLSFILLFSCAGSNYEDNHNDKPVSSFFMDVEEANVGDTIYFHNFSQNADSYLWKFGDGQQSTTTNPTHIYTSEGKYTVILEASSYSETHSSSRKINILP